MIRILVGPIVLLGLSASEYSSQTRVAAAPAPVVQGDVRDSLNGVGPQQ